jgi:hypothetical protein
MGTSSVARQFVTCAPLAAVLIVLLPAFSAAQEPVKSFDQLNTRLKPGDTVWITDAQGREVKGKILELHDASIALDSNGQTTLQVDSVRLVQRSTKSVGKAALWGMLVGGVAFPALAALGAAGGSHCEYECLPTGVVVITLAGIGAGIGAGLGAVHGAVHPAGREEVYRAPGASGTARLSVAPVITPRTKGVALSYSF